MLRSLRTAALGLSAQQLNIDTISNNLSNVNTTGYKKNNVEFQDLLYETIQAGNSESRNGNVKPSELQIGLGNKPVSTFRSFSQGSIQETNNPLDVAIDGKGFFRIQQTDGSFAYTRDGAFRVTADGSMVTANGLPVYPDIIIPNEASAVKIGVDGIVTVVYEGDPNPEEVGQLELVSFMNPAGLKAMGSNLYAETEASGDPIVGLPGEDGLGSINQGYLEKSNVDIVQEMISLIVAQRAYEINSKAISTSDEILQMTNNLKR
jgi:flagellar basal-body rod protein FlgG